MKNDFVHLHLHTQYSLLRGAMRIEDALARCRELGMSALAITDTNGLYGAVPFYLKAREMGIKPIIGAEVEWNGASAVCLAQNLEGYRNLCRLITARNLQSEFDLPQAVLRYSDGLVVLSSTPAILEALARDLPDGRLYVDVQVFLGQAASLFVKDPVQCLNSEPLALNPSAIRAVRAKLAGRGRAGDLRLLAKRLGLPIVATNDVNCLTPDDYLTHCILSAVRENVLLTELQPSQIEHPEACMKSPAEMEAIFSYMPEAVRNTRRIAEECAFEWPMGKPIFPKPDLPPDESPASCLRKVAYQGAQAHYRPLREDVRARLDYELNVIENLGFSGYFLIVWGIVQEARRRGIPIVGRGSAADSLVSYCLGITRADPVRYNLYFERFLNPARTDPPDIDLDMCWRRRDEMLNYVYERYGNDRVAMVSNHNLYQARSAFRDIVRILGMPLAEPASAGPERGDDAEGRPRRLEEMSQALPHDSVANLRELIRLDPAWRRFPINEEPYRSIISIAERIDGYPRHLGIHVGGMVVGERPLTDYVPLQIATKGIVITQFEMDAIEKIGLVKMDLLGNRALSAISDTAEAVRRRGVPLDLDDIPDGDPLAASLSRQGRTLGCFQIESPGMRNLLKMMRARTRDDLIVALSLIRPGPSASGMKERYLRRRQGLEKPEYPCPELEPVLQETYGILLYQEHILKVAEVVAGFTLAEGDQLRKAITKERSPEKIGALRERFLAGAQGRGVSAENAHRIWENILHFAGFSFNKAHAATYGRLAYAAVYLKARYPAEFIAAVMANLSGFYPPRVHLEEARRLGVRILPPDVGASEYRHTAGPDWIRLGFMQVRDLAGSTVDTILQERASLGERGAQRPFTSLADFLGRVRPSRPEAENLILCGAMDSLGVPRLALLWELYLGAKQQPPPRGPATQAVLIRESEAESACSIGASRTTVLAALSDYPKDKKLRHELEILGMTVTEHPTYLFRDRIAPYRPVPCATAPRHVGKRITLAGIVDCTRRTATSDNKPMFFLTLEDATGLAEVVFFPAVYQRFGHVLAESGVLVVKGRVESQLGAVTVQAEWARAL